jgi:choline dehydrogenase-like flavoprotein
MSQTIYDVCIIGSGAAGGMAAKQLCEAGAKVILLEAGRKITSADLLSHKWPYELPYRGLHGEKQAPFTTPGFHRDIRYEQCDPVGIDRVRVLGGRTMHWNAVVLRYAPSDFRQRSTYGVEEDWPVSYEELAPYYDRVEQLIGVCGQDDHLPIVPAGKHYLPPLRPRCSEEILRRTCRPMGIPVIPVRKAVLTRPYDGRPPCHYCGHCMDGCDAGAIFSTPVSLLPKAAATGNLTLRTNVVAREILVDREGRARAVAVIDRITKKEEEIRARIFVLGCATVETARLLLNSRSPQHPNGLGNGNDVIGRYLNGHLTGNVHVYLDELEGRPPVNQDGATDHVYVVRHRTDSVTGTFGFQVNFDGYMFPHQAFNLRGYGASYKAEVRRLQGASLLLGGYGKIFGRPENRVTVDARQTDEFGIPLPVVHFRYGSEDLEVYAALQETAHTITTAMKGQVFPAFGKLPWAFASHDVGTARMGSDPRTSALNGWGQMREANNVFVVDGSAFPTSSEKNPTLTIMALSMRACEHIMQQRRRGELA